MAKHKTRLENLRAVFHKLGKVGVSADKLKVSTLLGSLGCIMALVRSAA